MDYAKVRYEAIKSFIKKERFYWEEIDAGQAYIGGPWHGDEKMVVFSMDGYAAYIVPKPLWFLNVPDRADKTNVFSHNLEHVSDAKLAKEGTEMARVEKVGVLKKLVTEDGKFAWVREALLKPFGKQVSFYVLDNHSPVFVAQYGFVVGFVMPYRYE